MELYESNQALCVGRITDPMFSARNSQLQANQRMLLEEVVIAEATAAKERLDTGSGVRLKASLGSGRDQHHPRAHGKS